MEWVNYHHLLYFWMVAKHGGITAAAHRLRLRPPTLSTQVRLLEESLGERLLVREGRRLALTDAGRVVFGYAEEIFALGRDMLDAVKRRAAPFGLRLVAGVADAVPKLVAQKLLQPALAIPEPVAIVCREDRHERLLAALSVHELDVVISDAPTSAALGVRAFNHLLGECGLSFLAARSLAATLTGRFPRILHGARFVLPLEDSSARRLLDAWFESHGLRPHIAGEFEDSALMKAFGEAGAGVFAVPSVIEREVARQLNAKVLGRTDEIRARYYAISTERRLKHPAVVALSEAARTKLFG